MLNEAQDVMKYLVKYGENFSFTLSFNAGAQDIGI